MALCRDGWLGAPDFQHRSPSEGFYQAEVQAPILRSPDASPDLWTSSFGARWTALLGGGLFCPWLVKYLCQRSCGQTLRVAPKRKAPESLGLHTFIYSCYRSASQGRTPGLAAPEFHGHYVGSVE